MKKAKCILAISLVLTIGLTQTSCIGSYSMTGKVYNWNKNVGDKWANSFVHVALWIVPVYEFSLFVDGVILNTIEFWSGSSPMALNQGEFDKKIVAKDGNVYEITASQNKFEFTQVEGTAKGKKGAFVFNPETQDWIYE